MGSNEGARRDIGFHARHTLTSRVKLVTMIALMLPRCSARIHGLNVTGTLNTTEAAEVYEVRVSLLLRKLIAEHLVAGIKKPASCLDTYHYQRLRRVGHIRL